MFGFFLTITNTTYQKLIRSINEKEYDHIGMFYDSNMSSKREYIVFNYIDGQKVKKYIPTNSIIKHFILKEEYKCQFTFFIASVSDYPDIFIILKLFMKQFEIGIDDIFETYIENKIKLEGTILGSPPVKKKLSDIISDITTVNNNISVDFIRDRRDCHLLFDKFLENNDNSLLYNQSEIKKLKSIIDRQNNIINCLTEIFQSGDYKTEKVERLLGIECKKILIDRNSTELVELNSYINSILESDNIVVINLPYIKKLLDELNILNISVYDKKRIPCIISFNEIDEDMKNKLINIQTNENIGSYSKNEIKELLFYIESINHNNEYDDFINKLIGILQ